MKVQRIKTKLGIESTEMWLKFWEDYEPEKEGIPEGLPKKDREKVAKGESLEDLKARKVKHHLEMLKRLRG
jgi:hypothetical protein